MFYSLGVYMEVCIGRRAEGEDGGKDEGEGGEDDGEEEDDDDDEDEV